MQKNFVTYIEEANISQYLNKFFDDIVEDKDRSKFKKLKKEISSLISKRNSYMHMGNMNDATLKNCRRYLSAVKDLFDIEKSKPWGT